MGRTARFALALGLAGAMACAAPAAPEPDAAHDSGPVGRLIDSVARDTGVPADLLLAIAVEEGGIQLPAHRAVVEDDGVPVAGLFELRHGRLNTLALAAAQAGVSEDALRADTDLATKAGARVIARLGAEHGAGADPASWREALEALSGMDDFEAHNYASRVLALVRGGGRFAARDGEVVRLAAHPELDVGDTAQIVRFASPEFPGAIWFDTSCTNKCTVGRPLGNAAVDKIVIHDTEGGWDGSVATLQNDSGKSVHYIVDADGGRVGQFRVEGDTTWHAGNYYYNETSVGIEHVGVATDPAGYSDGLYATSKALVESIRTRWNVPLDRTHIVGHYQVPNGSNIPESSPPCDGLDGCETNANYGGANNHRDPGYNWQWCQYMESLGGSCSCADTWPLWNCTTDKAEAWRCSGGTVEKEDCANGCDVMPTGTADVCHVAAGGGPDGGTGSGSGSGSGPDAGTGPGPGDGEGGGGSDDPNGALVGGCAANGGGGSAGAMLCALVALGVTRRRRRLP